MEKELKEVIAAHENLIKAQKKTARVMGDWRIQNEVSLREVGKLLGISGQAYWNIELGTTPISLEIARKALKGLPPTNPLTR